MTFCQQCGATLTPTNRFCIGCGCKVSAAAAPAAASFSPPPVAPTAVRMGANKGDDWLPRALSSSPSSGAPSYTGSVAQTEAVLGQMIGETNRVFGELGVSVGATKRPAASATPAVNCSSCSRSLNSSTAISAAGRFFHPQCFTCQKCFSEIQTEGDGSFVVKGKEGEKQEIWCTACVKREKASKAATSQPILPSAVGVAPFKPSSAASPTGLTASQRADFLSRRDAGKVCCGACGVVMQSSGVTTLRGQSFHEECFCCCVCDRPIGAEGEYGEQGGKPVHAACMRSAASTTCACCSQSISGKFVRASNGAPYHRECVKCSRCNKDVSNIGYTIRENKMMCGGCASAATPYISVSSNAVLNEKFNRDMGGIRYNQVTREVTKVPPPNTTKFNAPTNSATTRPSPSSAASSSTPSSSSTAASSSSSAGSSRFCQQCGSALAGSKFCPECGAKAV